MELGSKNVEIAGRTRDDIQEALRERGFGTLAFEMSPTEIRVSVVRRIGPPGGPYRPGGAMVEAKVTADGYRSAEAFVGLVSSVSDALAAAFLAGLETR